VEHDRAAAVGRGHGRDAGEIDAGRDDLRLRHPADRVVASDDLGTGFLSEGELLRRLAADVRAQVLHDRLLAEQL
jgi:hypothetical protein